MDVPTNGTKFTKNFDTITALLTKWFYQPFFRVFFRILEGLKTGIIYGGT